MSKPKRKKQQAQEIKPAQQVQEATQTEQAQEAPISERQVKLLIALAAQKSGRPREEISLAEAFAILRPEEDAERQAIFDRAANNAADRFIDTLPIEIQERLRAAAQSSDSEYQQAITENKIGGKSVSDALTEFLAETFATDKDIQATLQRIREQLRETLEMFARTVAPSIREGMARLEQTADALQATELFRDLQTFAEISQQALAVVPFLEAALKEAQEDPQTAAQFADTTIEDLKDLPFSFISSLSFDEEPAVIRPEDQPLFDRYKPIIKRAWQLKAQAEAPEPGTDIALPKLSYTPTRQLTTTTDKLMSVFFSLTAPSPKAINGQRQMVPLKYEGRKSKKAITLFYDYAYNEEELARAGITNRAFGSYEFFVATALDNLREAGNDIVSYSKILSEMGFGAKPAQKQIEQLASTLLKGATTTIHIDNREVQKAWENKGTYSELIGQVFPITIRNERYLANGYIADGAVKINDYSPFRILAGSIGHLTAWKKEILQLYTGRKTERYWSVMQFLIRNIGWMRHSKRAPKIKYSTLYQHTGDTTPRGQQLTRDMLYRLLDEVFKPAGYVRAYKETGGPEPGVIITLDANQQQAQLPK